MLGGVSPRGDLRPAHAESECDEQETSQGKSRGAKTEAGQTRCLRDSRFRVADEQEGQRQKEIASDQRGRRPVLQWPAGPPPPRSRTRPVRSEERRVGKECVRPCRTRWG